MVSPGREWVSAALEPVTPFLQSPFDGLQLLVPYSVVLLSGFKRLA